MNEIANITADALSIQERDSFRAAGWQKVIAPAKVNLCLAIGERRADGYHDANTVLHTLHLHDVVYVRRKIPTDETFGSGIPQVLMVSDGELSVPDIPSEDNLAAKAALALMKAVGADAQSTDIVIRIEKNIPSQAGLGGASSDAAATLVALAKSLGLKADAPEIEEVARTLGADVAFFLRGGCAYYDNVGDRYVHSLVPAKFPVALIKPDAGVSTPEAYRAFDENPIAVPAELAQQAFDAREASEVPLFNNLEAAAATVAPELATVSAWLAEQDEVQKSLLCGSGACSFAICENFNAACKLVGEARNHGWWARATYFGSARAMSLETGA